MKCTFTGDEIAVVLSIMSIAISVANIALIFVTRGGK